MRYSYPPVNRKPAGRFFWPHRSPPSPRPADPPRETHPRAAQGRALWRGDERLGSLDAPVKLGMRVLVLGGNRQDTVELLELGRLH